ncbi:hypothetical protein [Streptomyces fungicidicus]|uniref:hypothetical protein n=1 Tax=Streptomyces fungicidicus TaxID=68203 RepID=UPI003819F2F1
MPSNSSQSDAQQGGAAESGPFIIENGVAYLRAPFTLASAAGPTPPYVVIDGTPYVVVPAPVPGSTPVTPTVPVSPANRAAQADTTVPSPPMTATLGFPSVPGQFYPMPYPASPMPDPQTAAPADPVSAALGAVLDSVTAPAQQLPAPSWAAVAVFALILGAVITFIVLGIEAGAALGVLALLGMVAAYIRRGLA